MNDDTLVRPANLADALAFLADVDPLARSFVAIGDDGQPDGPPFNLENIVAVNAAPEIDDPLSVGQIDRILGLRVNDETHVDLFRIRRVA